MVILLADKKMETSFLIQQSLFINGNSEEKQEKENIFLIFFFKKTKWILISKKFIVNKDIKLPNIAFSIFCSIKKKSFFFKVSMKTIRLIILFFFIIFRFISQKLLNNFG